MAAVSGGDAESPPASNEGDAAAEEWMFDLLRQEGLQPRDRVLHLRVDHTSPAGAQSWRSFLEDRYYIRRGNAAELLALGDETGEFDIAVAESIFPALPFNTVARCIASVVRRLKPAGR